MKANRKDKLVAALGARGYVPHQNSLSSRYAEFTPGPRARLLLKSSDHRVLVGSLGALRWTTGTIADSHTFDPRTVDHLIRCGESVLKEKKK